MNSKYAKYANVGSDVSAEDPLTFCLVSTSDSKFMHGGGPTFVQGPMSENCQMFMSNRCADTWDEYCEYFYRNQRPSSGDIYSIQTPSPSQINSQYTQGVPSQSLGNQLLLNTSLERFCNLNSSESYSACQPFNPLDPKSPLVCGFQLPANTPLQCRVDTKVIDQDPVMERCLANPSAALLPLVNICNTAKRDGVDLSGTKIGEFCRRMA